MESLQYLYIDKMTIKVLITCNMQTIIPDNKLKILFKDQFHLQHQNDYFYVK